MYAISSQNVIINQVDLHGCIRTSVAALKIPTGERLAEPMCSMGNAFESSIYILVISTFLVQFNPFWPITALYSRLLYMASPCQA